MVYAFVLTMSAISLPVKVPEKCLRINNIGYTGKTRVGINLRAEKFRNIFIYIIYNNYISVHRNTKTQISKIKIKQIKCLLEITFSENHIVIVVNYIFLTLGAYCSYFSKKSE